MRSPLSGNVLEIGCGTGANSFFLARKTGLDVLGTDICVPFIEEAKERFQLPNLRYGVLDFNQASQFDGETFDYIVGNGILHHLYHHLSDALRNMRRLLKPEGKVIFLEPNLYNPYIFSIFRFPRLRKLAHLEPDEMAFSKRHVTKLLSSAGYRDIRVEYKDFLLPGIPDALIGPSIAVGAVLERVPLVRMTSQSIFISATKS
jgi:ubiquinone/menaquinone biosynthesis C-methylase UbiE